MLIRVGILTAPHIEAEKRDNGFLLRRVRIGIGFHWDRTEDQEFAGELEILHNADGTQTAVNVIDLEDYLCSVISSEMSADSDMELLRAHAIISRSWAMRAIEANRQTAHLSGSKIRQISYESNGHNGYDVCADDHCQRYEGLSRMNARAVEAVQATQGMTLQYTDPETLQSVICDTRFYKCCGGRTELFSTCWEDKDYPYLQSVECPFCGKATQPQYRQVLRQSLNSYDQETPDFHTWQVHYTRQELGAIFLRKTGMDLGDITDIIPIQRGASGRIFKMEVRGSKGSLTIGKELKIRRSLSDTCLYSSWFDILTTEDGFTLNGHGWGHGVGLCQIGAAVMAADGYTAEQILAHYYPHTKVAMTC